MYHTRITAPWYRAIIQWDKKYIFLPDRSEQQILREGESLSEHIIQSNNPNALLFSISKREEIVTDLYDGDEIIKTNLDLLNYDSTEEKKSLKTLLLLQEKDMIIIDQSYRAIKSDDEIRKIQKAQQTTLDAIDFATQDIKPGMYEYEIAAKLSYYYASKGYSDAFPPIVASGKNACTLHYTANNAVINEWDILLIDTGAYIDGYCGDCSRSIIIAWEDKINHVRPKQTVIDILHTVHDACISYTKPWITLKDLHHYAMNLLEIEIQKIWLSDAKQYMPHGIGHSIGLDVHDPLQKDHILQSGMCITIEPGLYIPERNIWARYENIVVLTDQWCQTLS